MDVTYEGPADVRALSPEDLAKAGVEISHPYSFRRGIAQEVPNDMGDALVSNPLFGSFQVAPEVPLDFTLEDAIAEHHDSPPPPSEEAPSIVDASRIE